MAPSKSLPRWLVFAVSMMVLQAGLVFAMFSVQEDILAYPQFQINFQETSSIIEEEASKRLSAASSFSAKSIASPTPAGIDSPNGPNKQWDLRHPNSKSSTGPNQAQDSYEEVDITYETMWLKSKKYLCTIPILKPPPKLNETELRESKILEEAENSRAVSNGWELLKGLEGGCIYFISGWWSYSYCHNDIVEQFHQLPPANGVPMLPPTRDPRSASYVLGRAGEGEKEKGDYEMAANGEAKYLTLKMGAGTYCEITGKGRRIEVQFQCNPKTVNDRIAYIKEVTTCCYLMVINTPRLCVDKVFLPPVSGQAHAINCQEIIPKNAGHATAQKPTPELDSGATAQEIIDEVYKWQDEDVIKYLADIGLLITENDDGTFAVEQTKNMDREFQEGLEKLYTAPGELVVKTISVEGVLKPELVTVDEDGEEHELRVPNGEEEKLPGHDEL